MKPVRSWGWTKNKQKHKLNHVPGLTHGLDQKSEPGQFDRFQRGPDAVAGGTGIGLSLVKGFAEAQGGSVSAENRHGGGALFTIKLPLSKLPPVPEEKE